MEPETKARIDYLYKREIERDRMRKVALDWAGHAAWGLFILSMFALTMAVVWRAMSWVG